MNPPLKPDESDCCNSGCNPCILDVYEAQLQKYHKQKQCGDIPVRNCISETTYTAFKVVKIEQHTRDTYLYTFRHHGLNNIESDIIYTPGQHFLIKGCCNGENFTRAYTPIPMQNSSSCSFTILVKLHEHGKMSKYLRTLKRDDETLWRGPYGDYKISFNAKFLLLLAQGTGIAPLYSVICKLTESDECETFLKLFLCCRTERDILLRDKLYDLSSFWNFSYEIFLTRGEGTRCKYNEVLHLQRLGHDRIKSYVDNLDVSEFQALICGSERFAEEIFHEIANCGVDKTRIFCF